MKFQDLHVTHHKDRKRVARGISAGGGKTAGRGTKGQNSRSGGQRNPGFEGGQGPLFHRIPKLKGFRSLSPKKQIVHTSQLDKLSGRSKVTVAELHKAGLIQSRVRDVKLLFDKDPKSAHQVTLVSASAEAKQSLARTGGSFEELKYQQARQVSTDKTERSGDKPTEASA